MQGKDAVLPGVLLRGEAGEVGGDDTSPNLLRRAFTEGDFELSLPLELIDSGDFTLGGVLGRVFLTGADDVSFDPAFQEATAPTALFLVAEEGPSIITHELLLVTVSL